MKHSPLSDLAPNERTALGQRIRRVVEQIGTQKEAARVAQISLAQLKKYLMGATSPPAIVLNRLCAESGYSLDWLLTGEGPERRDPGGREAAAIRRAADDPVLAETIVEATAHGAITRELVRMPPLLGRVWREAGLELSEEAVGELVDELLEEMEAAEIPYSLWPKSIAVAIVAHKQALRLLRRPQEPR